jgi:hypothetical protein
MQAAVVARGAAGRGRRVRAAGSQRVATVKTHRAVVPGTLGTQGDEREAPACETENSVAQHTHTSRRCVVVRCLPVASAALPSRRELWCPHAQPGTTHGLTPGAERQLHLRTNKLIAPICQVEAGSCGQTPLTTGVALDAAAVARASRGGFDTCSVRTLEKPLRTVRGCTCRSTYMVGSQVRLSALTLLGLVSSSAGGEQQSVASLQAARGWSHPPCRHFKIQSCCCLGSAFECGGFPNPHSTRLESFFVRDGYARYGFQLGWHQLGASGVV